MEFLNFVNSPDRVLSTSCNRGRRRYSKRKFYSCVTGVGGDRGPRESRRRLDSETKRNETEHL